MIPDADLKIETYDPRPSGGQRVGTVNGVKITHLPSGLVAIANSDRSQHRNKAVALSMIEGGITSPHFRG